MLNPYKILLAVTVFAVSGCSCFPPPGCCPPCAAVNYSGMNCAPMNVGFVNTSAAAACQQVACQPVAYQPAAYSGRQSLQRTASLPTMPTPSRRQIFNERIRMPQLCTAVAPPTLNLDWPITQKYSQCLTDYSLATASSRSYGCQCGNSGGCDQCGLCDSCDIEPSCAAPSCAAPLTMCEDSSCAAPQSVYSSVDFSNGLTEYSSSGQCSCQNRSELMSVDSSPTNARSFAESSGTKGNAAVPPPAPLPAPPAIDDEAAAPLPKPRQTQPSEKRVPVAPAQGNLVDPPQSKIVQPKTVPLPPGQAGEETLPGVDSVPNLKPESDAPRVFQPDPSAQPAAAPNTEPMPIIDLMRLQMHSQRQTTRTVSPALHQTSGETETVIIPQRVVVRKRVQ